MKKYQLCDAVYYADSKDRTNIYAPGRLTWVSPYGEGGNAGIAADNISTVGTNVLSAAMIQLLKDVEFKADGSIVASYAEEINITMDQMIRPVWDSSLQRTALFGNLLLQIWLIGM